MIVAFFDARIDASYFDLRSDRRFLGMFSINFDPTAETRELALCRPKELAHTETNRRAGRIDLIALDR